MKRIYRSVRDKKIFGVCGGLAEATGIDPTVVRVVLVVTTVFAGFAPLPIYVIAAMVMPKDPTYDPGSGAAFYGASPNIGASGWNGAKQTASAWEAERPPAGAGPASAAGGRAPQGQPAQGFYPPGGPAASSIDDLMADIEKKAMQKEIEALKAKLAQYEKDRKGDD